MRERIIYDREGKVKARFVNGECVFFSDEYKDPDKKSWQVMEDIKPYKSMINGQEITSRSKHKAHLKAHGCIEVGNETKYLMNPEKDGRPKPPPGLRQEIMQIAAEKLRYRR